MNKHIEEEDTGQTCQHILFHWRWLHAGQAESRERGRKIFCESETCPLRTSWACCYMQLRPCSTKQSQQHNYTYAHASLRNLCVISWQVVANLWKVSSGWQENYINYSNTTKNNILFIDVSASRRKPSSGLTSGAGRQYVKACPTYGTSFYILTTGTGSQFLVVLE